MASSKSMWISAVSSSMWMAAAARPSAASFDIVPLAASFEWPPARMTEVSRLEMWLNMASTSGSVSAPGSRTTPVSTPTRSRNFRVSSASSSWARNQSSGDTLCGDSAFTFSYCASTASQNGCSLRLAGIRHGLAALLRPPTSSSAVVFGICGGIALRLGHLPVDHAVGAMRGDFLERMEIRRSRDILRAGI